MLYVRGNHKDYDNWAAQGAEGWSFKDVFPYFLKLEDNRNIEFLTNGYHASGGPITVEKPGYQPEIKNRILEAAQQLGYKVIDSNGARQTGFYDLQGNLRNGQRCNTAQAYLVPVENRTNLDIIGGAHVKKIPVIADLPVGNNFQDHCGTFLPFVLNEIPLNEKLRSPRNIKEYINRRTGPLSSVEFISSMAFLGGQEEDFPDHELYFAEITKIIPKEQVGFKPIIYKLLVSPYENGPMMVCLSQLLHPKSRGTVRLQSTNPYDPPLIDPNYFDDPADIESIVRGLKTCRKIGLSEPMRELGVKPFATILPGFTNLIPDLDLYFKLLARLVVVTLSHQVGTAKMGDPRDPTTVVDPLLRYIKSRNNHLKRDSSMKKQECVFPLIMLAEDKKCDNLTESGVICTRLLLLEKILGFTLRVIQKSWIA
ncbi:Oxygen-dependent choline dehydrogenase [Araneus ventricosus]|uniref:Oxygen-dependent choline dehydrogenase n=1 Tax=Araneus ventricosus TaxID=182803 RepID=A0A4Y2HT76_ARAVE|nr:Oxygen-dependent choline dehydrogenase [Araneus ventricosus]